MKYNQPFDATDPAGNAAYINGNPAASVRGSIPPAAAFETPQREIVAVIDEADILPSNADLKQMLRAIRGGRLTAFVDIGTANALAIAPKTPHTVLGLRLPFRIFPAATNTQADVTLTINGTLVGAVVRNDGSALGLGDIERGCPFDVVYDGQAFRLMGPGRIENPRIRGTSPIYFGTDGNDGNDGSPAAPLRTLGAALALAQSYYLLGRPLTIQITQPGTYDIPTSLPAIVGSIVLRGNPSAQNSYTLRGAGPAGSTGRAVLGPDGWALGLIGLTVRNTGTSHHTLASSGTGALTLNNVTLVSDATLPYSHCFVSGSSASATINGGCIWASSASSMFEARAGEVAITSNANLAVQNSPTFSSAAAVCSDCGRFNVRGGVAVSGGASGKRFAVNTNAVIRAGGGGENLFPGDQIGTRDNGGIYLP